MRFLLFCLLALPIDANAIRQYRCGERVQYRPCEMKLFEDFRAGLGDSTRHAPRPHRAMQRSGIPGPLYAEITNSAYQPISDGDGKWTGKVRGNGEVALTLQFLKDGKIHLERPMGGTILVDDETTFSFITALPKASECIWNINYCGS